MILRNLQTELASAKHPVAKALYYENGCRVLCIGFKKAMLMKEHITKQPATLYVLSGEVLYKTATSSQKLGQFDEIQIPIDLPHSVEAIEDSLCLLLQSPLQQ
ncbi:hypothetical protein ABDK00_005385 [Niabella insulamsoli]|uniref:hypothetical protein n=1 Tax=Niabella insulamsoli TaxID=3144874 RepID=UPI0031FC18C3